jgi:hypothetical protein
MMNLNNNYISNQSESATHTISALAEKYKTVSGISPEEAEYLLSWAEASPDTAGTSRDQAIMLLVNQYGFERCRGSDADVADRLYNVVKQEIQRGAPAMLKQLFPNATATEDFLKAYSFFHADEKNGKAFRITDILQSSMSGDDVATARIHFAKQYIGAAAPHYVIDKEDARGNEEAKRHEYLMRDAAALTQAVLVDASASNESIDAAEKYLEEIVGLEKMKSNLDKAKAPLVSADEEPQDIFSENTTTLVHVMAQVQDRNAETNYGIPVLELLEHGCDRAVNAARKIRARFDLY